MIKHRTLYKTDTKGKTRYWFAEQEGNQYRTTAGIDGVASSMIVSEWTTCEGKGKRNPVEQAASEIESHYTKKLKRSYYENIADIGQCRFLEPMLAEKYKDGQGKPVHANKCQFPGWVQQKRNGARGVASVSEGLKSRGGEDWVSSPHILDDLQELFAAHPEVKLDGELFNPQYADDLGSLMSLIRQTKPTQADLDASAKMVQFWVFDLITDDPNENFGSRYAKLQKLVDQYCKGKRIFIVPTWEVNSHAEIETKIDEFIADGHEGLIFRNDAPYEFKRTTSLLKYKKFMDKEFEIVEVLEGKGKMAGLCAKFWLKDSEGRKFKASPNGNRTYFKEILDNQKDYIGKMATVTFHCYTPKTVRGGGVPFHGRVTAIRIDL